MPVFTHMSSRVTNYNHSILAVSEQQPETATIEASGWLGHQRDRCYEYDDDSVIAVDWDCPCLIV